MNTHDLEFFLHFGYFPNYQGNPKYKLDYSRIDRAQYSGYRESDLIEHGAMLFRHGMAHVYKPQQKNIVPISGGLDSRTILAGLLEHTNAEDIHTYTFGCESTWDYKIGNKIAAKYGTRHTSFALDKLEWREDDLIEAAKRFDCQTMLFHHVPIPLLKQYEDGITWSGYIGDAVVGGHLKAEPADTMITAKTRYWNKRAEIKSISVTQEDPANFYDNLAHSHHDPTFLTYDEQLLFDEVSNITAPHVLMKGFTYQTPFINNNFFDFFMSIPDEHRYERRLFIKMARATWPEIFSMPVKMRHNLTLGAPNWMWQTRRAKLKIATTLKKTVPQVKWAPSPVINFMDFDAMARHNPDFKSLIEKSMHNLKARNIIPWVDPVEIFNKHRRYKNNHGDALKILTSLEIILKTKGA